jgi:hypothetical protein
MMRSSSILLGLLVIAFLQGPAPAVADPVALRQAGEDRQLSLEAGWRDATVAWWFRPDLGLAVDVGLRGQAVGLSLGGRLALLDGPRHWGVDVFFAGGLRVLLPEPGLALTLTPAIAAGSRGPVIATLGLALPAAARLGSKQARLPILVELRLGGQPGPVSFGVRGALGAVLAPGEPVSVAMQWSAWLSVRLPDPGPTDALPDRDEEPAS